MSIYESRFGIGQKLSLVLLVTATASMLVMGLIYHVRSQNIMLDMIQSHLRVLASQIETQVTMAVDHNRERINLIQSRTQLRRSLRQVVKAPADSKQEHLSKINAIIHDAKNSVADIKMLAVTNTTGNVVEATEPNLVGQVLDIESRGDTQTRVSAQVIDNGRNISLRFVDYLIIDSEHTGYIVVDVDTTLFEHALYNQSRSSTSLKAILYYLDEGNNPIPLLLSQKLAYSNELLSKYVSLLKTSPENQIVEMKVNQQNEELGIHNILDNGWGIMLHVDRDHALKLMLEQGDYLIFSIILISCLLLMVSLIIGKRITKPIIDMAFVAKMISSGDFSKRIDQLSKDELGMLGNSLNRMADYLINANVELDKKVKEKTLELQVANENLSKLNSELEHITQMDPLTKINNRRSFDSTLNKEVKRANRDNTPLSILMLDVDFFKKLNDNLGHSKGDECLIKVASALKESIHRETDFVARYGGEEFVLLLPNTDQDAALQVSNNIHKILAQTAIPHPDSDVSNFVTFSIGVRTLKPGEKLENADLIEQADVALYNAKKRGRNRTEVF